MKEGRERVMGGIEIELFSVQLGCLYKKMLSLLAYF